MTFFQPYNFFAKLLHRSKTVTHHNDGASFAAKLLNLFAAFSLKRLVTNSEYFVNEQNLRLYVRGDRKTKANDHAR